MMRRGVVTVYLSIVSILILSLLFVLLESARVYTIGTMTDQFADMAAEMTCSAYVRPLADRYGIFVFDSGEDESNLEQFESFLKLNLEASNGDSSRLFHLQAQVASVDVEATTSVRDNSWETLTEQIERCMAYKFGEEVLSGLKEMLTQMFSTEAENSITDYTEALANGGAAMDTALAATETEETSLDEDEGVEIADPRTGIGRWLRNGLLSLVMEDQSISGRTIQTEDCSYHIQEESRWQMLTDFNNYRTVASNLRAQNLLKTIQQGIAKQGTHLIVNSYILQHFKSLSASDSDQWQDTETVLNYEIEYILYGHTSDRENLENVLTGIFMIRTLCNLAYLYTNQGKCSVLNQAVQSIALASVIPVVGQVIQLLMMISWACGEAVVDCSALVRGKSVPLMKTDTSWQLSFQQLLQIARSGGKASSYVKTSQNGLSYNDYLFILMILTSSESQYIRMTQLMEKNVRLTQGYETFAFKNSKTSIEWQGSVWISPAFWQHPTQIRHSFDTVFSY